MALNTAIGEWARSSPWAWESVAVVTALLVGIGLMPVLIFYVGVASLGRYEGASLHALYTSLFQGMTDGSVASWVVFLGPYALYLLFRGLRVWWRAGTGAI